MDPGSRRAFQYHDDSAIICSCFSCAGTLMASNSGTTFELIGITRSRKLKNSDVNEDAKIIYLAEMPVQVSIQMKFRTPLW